MRSTTFSKAHFNRVSIINLLCQLDFVKCALAWLFTAVPTNIFNVVFYVPFNLHLCARLKTSPTRIHLSIQKHRHTATDAYSYSLTMMATEANRQDVLPFSLCVFQRSSWVICQPIFCPLLLLAVGQLKGGNGGLTEACHYVHFHLRDFEWERNGQDCQTQQSLLIKCMAVTLPVLITVKSKGSMQFECFLHQDNFLLTFQTIPQCGGIFVKLIIILLSRDKTAATENKTREGDYTGSLLRTHKCPIGVSCL